MQLRGVIGAVRASQDGINSGLAESIGRGKGQ